MDTEKRLEREKQRQTIVIISIFKYVLTQNKLRTTGLGPSPPENSQVTLDRVFSIYVQELLSLRFASLSWQNNIT